MKYEFCRLYAILLLQVVDIQAINIKLLKGTHAILQGENRYYSPVYGLPFVEEGVAESLYDLSISQVRRYVDFLLQGSGIDDTSRGLLVSGDVAAYERKKKDFILQHLSGENNATEHLVSYLFNRAGIEGSFLPTKTNPIQKLKIKHIGGLLRLVSLYEKYKKLLPTDKASFEVMIKDFGVVSWLGSNLNLRWGNYFKKEGGKLASLRYLFLEALSVYLIQVDATKKVWNKFINALVNSLDECCQLNKNSLYPPQTAQGILLGYMLLKVTSKKDLQDYFEGFLQRPISLSADEYVLNEMSRIAQQVPPVGNQVGFADWLCSYIYNKNYNSILPKMATAKSVHYAGAHFSDCVETLVRNVCNIVTYDVVARKLGSFARMSLALRDFYNVYSDQAQLTDIPIHQEWANIVENIPGLIYSLIKHPESLSTDALWIFDIEKFNINGFIPVERLPDTSLPEVKIIVNNKEYSLYEQEVLGKKYLLVPRSTGLICCELRSELANVVVLLNYLFDLEVCRSVLTILDTLSLERAMVKTSALLGLDVLSVKFEKDNHQIVQLQRGRGRFDLNVLNIHTYVSVEQGEADASNVLRNISYRNHPVESAILVSLVKNISLQDVSLIAQGDSAHVGKLLPYVFTKSSDRKLEVLGQLIDSKIAFAKKLYLQSLLFRLSYNPNFHYQSIFFEKIFHGNSISQFDKEFIQSLIVVLDIIEIINNGFSDIFRLYSLFLHYILHRYKALFKIVIDQSIVCFEKDIHTAELALNIIVLIEKLELFDPHYRYLVGMLLYKGLQVSVWQGVMKLALKLINSRVIQYNEWLVVFYEFISASLHDKASYFIALEKLEYGYKIGLLQDKHLQKLMKLIDDSEDFEQIDQHIIEISRYVDKFLATLKVTIMKSLHTHKEILGKVSQKMIAERPMPRIEIEA